MIEIMCEDGYGGLHHVGILGIETPSFKTEKQAKQWCAQRNWKITGKDGKHYELIIHEVFR